MSLPSRERGLKYYRTLRIPRKQYVAPLAGAWIEMLLFGKCGINRNNVAPLAGAWIEILCRLYHGQKSHRRSPRGSVD